MGGKRQARGNGDARRALNVHLPADLFVTASAISRVTNTTMQDLVSAALDKELRDRLKQGGKRLADAVEVAKSYDGSAGPSSS